MSDGTVLSLDMSAVIAAAGGMQKDTHVIAWGDYDKATNTGYLTMSNGTKVPVDMTQVIADAIASITQPTTLPPSGSAGGDLAGNYPAPTVKPATTEQAGKVELATETETLSGASDSLAVTPAGLKAVIGALPTSATVGGRTVEVMSPGGTYTLNNEPSYAMAVIKFPVAGIVTLQAQSLVYPETLRQFGFFQSVWHVPEAYAGAITTGTNQSTLAIADNMSEVAGVHRCYVPWDNTDIITVSNGYGIQVAAGDLLVYAPYVRTPDTQNITIIIGEISLAARYLRED